MKPPGKQWKPEDNTELPDKVFYAGGKERVYSSTMFNGDVGHRPWDDEPPVGNEKYMDTSLEKNAGKFMDIILNLNTHHWPPIHGSTFIDPRGSPRTIPAVLRGVKDSLQDTPYTKMTNGDLDLGPYLVLDGCSLIGIMPDKRLALGIVLHKKQGQVKRWFYNNQKNRSVGVKVVLKEQSNGKRIPCPNHIYLNMFFRPQCLIQEVADEAVVQGTKNNIDLINKVTAAAWVNATPEIRAEVMQEWEKRIQQLVALRAGQFDDIILTEEERAEVIEGLGSRLKKQFNVEMSLSNFAFVIVTAGYHPTKKRMESYSWEFRTEDSGGKTFINSFDRTAKSGVVPGGLRGDKHEMKAYYSSPLLAYMVDLESLKERQQSELLDATSSSDETCDGSENDDDIVAGNVLPLHGRLTAATNKGSVIAGLSLPPANDFNDEPIPDSPGVPFWRAPVPASSYFPNPQESSRPDSYKLSQFNLENLLPAYYETARIFFALVSTTHLVQDLLFPSSTAFPVIPPFVPPAIMPFVDEMEMTEVETMSAPLAMTTHQEHTPPDQPLALSFRASSERASLSSSILDERVAIPPTFQLSNEWVSATPHHVPNERVATPLPINSNERAATPNERASAPDIPHQSQNHRPTGSREVKTLVDTEQPTPDWLLQCLTSMQDPTFGDDWAKLLVKWQQLKEMLSKAKLTGKFLASRRLPKALLLWADGPHSFTNPFIITDIGQFGDDIVSWWNMIQPTSRHGAAEGQPVSSHKLLTCLCKGGQNGIMMVIFGLFWWRKDLDDLSQWQKLLTGVSATFDVLLNASGSGSHCG
ncbi:hypothetical protein IW261DRAFT_1575651 [Armillaria novae-zelandiae]|uniref:Uncharacterized protein n=1 Tax=Armillaria novae-zelandiae TaxID=153914 RepID=A0AA39ND18_9AGAR|nr:hypothetical protein IW261DRAFT_1575651 [Armillaria novae-zelandiae]